MKYLALVALVAVCATPSASHAAPPPGCTALPGTAAILARPERFLIFGEMHGTAEAPAAFAEIACEASKAGPVVVGLEWPVERQPALDAYMASTGDKAARAALFAGQAGRGPGDGRDSVAFYAMIERLRSLHAAGQNIRFIAFQTFRPVDPSGSQTPTETAMAEALLAGAEKSPRVVALVGNYHSRRTAPDLQGVAAFLPMAGHLPADQVLSFDIRHAGGASWSCLVRPGATPPYTSASVDCGSHPLSRPNGGPVGIALLPTRANGHDGIWSIGPITASPPMATEPAG